MNRRTFAIVVGCLLVGASVGAWAGMSMLGLSADDDGRLRVAVSNTYLGCAAREVLADEVEIVTLAGAGSCPGHFDLRPSQVADLRSCDVLIRFGFQQALEGQIARACPDLPVIRVTVRGGLGVPETFSRLAGDVLAGVSSLGLSPRHAGLSDALAERLDDLGAWGSGDANGRLAGVPVVASRHQAASLRWLGMEVVATLPAADAMRPSDLADAVGEGRQAGVKLVVANRPEGTKLARAVAEQLGATVVVLDNFPQRIRRGGFDEMVRANVDRLVAAVQGR